jgi:hypothetical protein
LATSINKSILQKSNFKLVIQKLPTVEYYVKGVSIPGIQFTEVTQGTSVGLDAYFPGDKISFGTLDVEFIVDEDLENFKEVYDWMDAIVPIKSSEDYESYTATVKTESGFISAVDNDLNQYSDITLVVNTNKNIPNKFFRFYDCFPTNLSGIDLESGADSSAVTSKVSFRFSYYDIKTAS